MEKRWQQLVVRDEQNVKVATALHVLMKECKNVLVKFLCAVVSTDTMSAYAQLVQLDYMKDTSCPPNRGLTYTNQWCGDTLMCRLQVNKLLSTLYPVDRFFIVASGNSSFTVFNAPVTHAGLEEHKAKVDTWFDMCKPGFSTLPLICSTGYKLAPVSPTFTKSVKIRTFWIQLSFCSLFAINTCEPTSQDPTGLLWVGFEYTAGCHEYTQLNSTTGAFGLSFIKISC